MKTRNFTRLIALLLLFVFAGGLKAQNDSTYIYQSFFGKDSTTINVFCNSIDDGTATHIVSIYNQDTVRINDNIYIKAHNDYELGELYYREDLKTGKLYQYAKPYSTGIWKEVLICDMSLKVGDVFVFPLGYEDDTIQSIVKNVEYNDGRKVIEFEDTHISSYTNTLFTEGVFPITFIDGNLMWYEELLCQYKDGEQVFQHPVFTKCYYGSVNVEEYESNNVNVNPTLFSNNETISISSDSEIKDVKMMDMLGRKIDISLNQTDENSCQISLKERYDSSVYLIIVETKNEVCYKKVVLQD